MLSVSIWVRKIPCAASINAFTRWECFATCRSGAEGVTFSVYRRGLPGGTGASRRSPHERVAVVIAGSLPLTTRSNQYIRVVMYYLTKWPEVYALPNLEAETLADIIMNKFYIRFGFPTELHSTMIMSLSCQCSCKCCALLGVRKT